MDYDELYKGLNKKVSVFVKPANKAGDLQVIGSQSPPVSPYAYVVVGNIILLVVLAIARPGFLTSSEEDDEGKIVTSMRWGRLILLIGITTCISTGVVHYRRTR